jgi:hypothetical protein
MGLLPFSRLDTGTVLESTLNRQGIFAAAVLDRLDEKNYRP